MARWQLAREMGKVISMDTIFELFTILNDIKLSIESATNTPVDISATIEKDGYYIKCHWPELPYQFSSVSRQIFTHDGFHKRNEALNSIKDRFITDYRQITENNYKNAVYFDLLETSK